MAKGYKSGGRTKGTQNKVSKALKEVISTIINSQQNKAIQTMNHLYKTDPDAYMKHYISLLRLVYPKEEKPTSEGFKTVVKRGNKID
jgi:hypothetical protein